MKVAGRRVADGNGRPAVLTALGSGEKLLAILPLTILSVGSVAGLAAISDGDPASAPSPAESGSAGPVLQETAARQVPTRSIPSAAPAAISATPAEVATGASPSPAPAAVEETSTDGSTDGPADGPADGSADGSGDSLSETPAPTDRPEEEEPTPPAPTSSATATPGPVGGDSLSEAEATAQCLASGISTADVLALGTCVQELLG